MIFDKDKFATKNEMFDFLKENKHSILSQKKMQTKNADSIVVSIKANTTKAAIVSDDELKVSVVINTTNILDSHDDVHVKGIWTKSLQESNMLMMLQEHQMKFDKIIADGEDLSAYVREFKWSELGYEFEGTTEALVFDATIKRDRNPFMFDQYKQGNVHNHSVGMRYVKILMAVNSEDSYWAEEKEIWDNYIGQVANKEDAEAIGMMWVVKEAKVVEGSAVPLGSNQFTPTLEVKGEPSHDTHREPQKCTRDIDTIYSFIKN